MFRNSNAVELRQTDRNVTEVQIGAVTLVFSYSTCVAFLDNTGWHVSENVWSSTTGKHLNRHTPVDKRDRLPHDVFAQQLDELQERLSSALVSFA